MQPRLQIRDRAVGAREVGLLAGLAGVLTQRRVLIAQLRQPVISRPGIGVHNRAALGRGADKLAQRTLGGVLQDRQTQAA
jgi:hypothetical protein